MKTARRKRQVPSAKVADNPLTTFSSDLLTPEEERVVVRIIHACGMVEVAKDVVLSPTFARDAIAALKAGAHILCDSMMVADGVTRARLPWKDRRYAPL